MLSRSVETDLILADRPEILYAYSLQDRCGVSKTKVTGPYPNSTTLTKKTTKDGLSSLSSLTGSIFGDAIALIRRSTNM